jgi:hypothetical protein
VGEKPTGRQVPQRSRPSEALRVSTKERCSDSEPPGYCSGQSLAAHTQSDDCRGVAGVEDDDDDDNNSNNKSPSGAAGGGRI